MTKPTLAQVSAWLLAVRSQFDIKEKSTDAKLACQGYAASMIQAYDANAFTPESREAVSETLKFFRLPDIRERLDSWVRINAPETEQLLAPEAAIAPISPEGRWFYSHMLKAPDETAAVRALGTLRSRDQAGFDWVVKTDHTAAGYAVQHGWKPSSTREDIQASYDDEAAIVRTIRKIQAPLPDGRYWTQAHEMMASYRRIVALNAPQHLHLFTERDGPVPVAFEEPVTLFGEIL